METRTANTAPVPVTPTQEDLIRLQVLSAMLVHLNYKGEIDTEIADRAKRIIAVKSGIRQDSIYL